MAAQPQLRAGTPPLPLVPCRQDPESQGGALLGKKKSSRSQQASLAGRRQVSNSQDGVNEKGKAPDRSASDIVSSLPKLALARRQDASVRQLRKSASTPVLLKGRQSQPTQTRKQANTTPGLAYVVQFGNNASLIRDLIQKRKGWISGAGNPDPFACGSYGLCRELSITEPSEDAPETSFIWSAYRNNGFLDAMANGSSVYVAFNSMNRLQVQLRQRQMPVPVRAHNHFEGASVLTRKCELRESIVAFYTLHGRDAFDIIPDTFVIRSGCQDPEFARWQTRFELGNVRQTQRIWIVKPGANSNQGHGIQVCDSVEQVRTIVDSKPIPWVVQKYIENPMLIRGRKFDIRMYCLVTQEPGAGPFHAYCFGDGYLRTTSAAYSTATLDRAIHITNDLVQQDTKSYGRFEEGNKMSLDQFKSYLAQSAKCAPTVFVDIVRQMKGVMIDTVQAAVDKLNPRSIDNCFELVGFDFLIDDNFRVWLIEVNAYPSLEVHSKHQAKLIPAMVDGVLRLTVDKIFGTGASEKPDTFPGVPCLHWEHIYCSSGPEGANVACDWVSQLP